jgi:gliding motility-associated-like protein
MPLVDILSAAACVNQTSWTQVTPQGGSFDYYGCDDTTVFNPSRVGELYNIDASGSINIPLTYKYRHPNGCAESVTADITVYGDNMPLIIYTLDSTYACLTSIDSGNPIINAHLKIYNASPTAEYQWYKDEELLYGCTGNEYHAQGMGNYRVHVSDAASACTFDAFSNVISLREYFLPPAPRVVSVDSARYYYSMAYDLNVVHNLSGFADSVSYRWYRNDISTDVFGNTYHIEHLGDADVAEYKVAAVTSNGCYVSSPPYRISLIYNDLFIPNIFTPNGDGINDKLEIVGISTCKSNTLTVLDKKGRVVYKRSNYDNDWDGGGYPDDIYYYHLEAVNADGKTKEYKGFFHIKSN